MAEHGEAKLADIFPLTWSENTKDEVFQRWTQGFFFSEDEPTALVQDFGGPCSVIGSVQAYLIKRLFFKNTSSGNESIHEWREINDEDRHCLLCHTLVDIWGLVARENFQVVLMKNHFIQGANSSETLETVQTVGESSNEDQGSCECTCKDFHKNICSEAQRQSQDVFHSTLRQFSCRKPEHLEDFISRNIHQFEGTFGVLLFLYSILLTKGVENIKSEMDENLAKPLIDPIHGHGGQGLVNLMLTGNAVSHVWDLERDIGGLSVYKTVFFYASVAQKHLGLSNYNNRLFDKNTNSFSKELQGIPKQPEIGFLTILESMRYCEVGSFLKCPKNPIWLLGSETHLTVLFTQENVDNNNSAANAIRVFKTFDLQENGFIERGKLKEVLEALELESDTEYVSLMESLLDPDSSGIILQGNFLQTFFPVEHRTLLEESDFAQCFQVYHYNGLPKCNGKEDNRRKVVYSEGVCTLLSGDVMCLSDGPFLNCLRTKWPYVIMEWKTDPQPSLN